MTVVADSPLSKTMPVFIEGQPIRGYARLSLEKPTSIQTISVHVSIDPSGAVLSVTESISAK